MTKYLDIYSDLIKLAAQMAKGEGVPDWSERVFSTGTPSYERRDMLSALRMADEAGITHALQLRAIADRLSAEMRSSNEPLPVAGWNKCECAGCPGLIPSQGASRDASPADLVGALQDVVHTDPGPVRAGKAVKSSEAYEKALKGRRREPNR